MRMSADVNVQRIETYMYILSKATTPKHTEGKNYCLCIFISYMQLGMCYSVQWKLRPIFKLRCAGVLNIRNICISSKLVALWHRHPCQWLCCFVALHHSKLIDNIWRYPLPCAEFLSLKSKTFKLMDALSLILIRSISGMSESN